MLPHGVTIILHSFWMKKKSIFKISTSPSSPVQRCVVPVISGLSLMETVHSWWPNLLPGYCPTPQLQDSWQFHAHFWTTLLGLCSFQNILAQTLHYVDYENHHRVWKHRLNTSIQRVPQTPDALVRHVMPAGHGRVIKWTKQITSPGHVYICFQPGLLVCFGSGSSTPQTQI